MELPESIRKGELGRWLVGIALAVPTIAAVLIENKVWILLVGLLAGGAAWWEFASNLFGPRYRGLAALGLAGWAATALGACLVGPEGQMAGLALSLALGGVYLMRVLPEGTDAVSVNLLSRYALGHLYISFFLSFVFLIKTLDSGSRLLFFVILVTALADTGAIYAGTRIKGPKLYPKVSPGKTISGVAGGCVVAVVGALVSGLYLPASFGKAELVVLGMGLALWGVVGDLFESAIKRALGVKDTSKILLGHGGFWDRLDSLLFNLPAFYFYFFLRPPV
ncbi:MAG: phosphatidate cytidylyltransferase [Deltaproteobacteria bacterium]|jgi:phosphatidate cytidylyltransferase|nr:phosphatidate cytidylyltransferase [Deltaproteobacteria bacterium]